MSASPRASRTCSGVAASEKRQGEGQHVVRRLPPIRLVAPLRREIADGLFPKDQGSVFPLQRQLALVALIIHQRAGADASRAIARQFHHGGLRPGGETRLHRAGRTQNRRAAARRRRRRAFFRTGRGRARAQPPPCPRRHSRFLGVKNSILLRRGWIDRRGRGHPARRTEARRGASEVARRSRRIGAQTRRIPKLLRGSGGEQRVLFVLVARNPPSPHGDKPTPHVQGIEGAHVAPALTASLAR